MQTNRTIGDKIAALRSLKKIEKGELAKRAGLSEKQLDLIESGTSIPSLGVLIRLSRALGLRLGTLLDDTVKEGPAVMRENEWNGANSFSTHNDDSREHMTFYSMAPNKADRHMEPFIVDIVPDKEQKAVKSAHEGEEFIYVMEGKVNVHYGNNLYELNKGDSIYLDSVVDHLVTTPGPHARILGIVYVPF